MLSDPEQARLYLKFSTQIVFHWRRFDDTYIVSPHSDLPFVREMMSKVVDQHTWHILSNIGYGAFAIYIIYTIIIILEPYLNLKSASIVAL